MIIFDEYAHCEHLLKDKINKITSRDLKYLAMYWDEKGFSESEILIKLKNWCNEKDPTYNVVINRKTLKNAVIFTRTYYLRKIATLTITEKEVEGIQSVGDYRIQKVLFCMLVTGKFFKFIPNRKKPNTKPSKFGVYFQGSMKDVFDLAGVTVKREEWKKIKHELNKLELLYPGTQPYNNFKLTYYSDDSIPVIAIIDYRNPVGYYQRYCGENIIECEDCGLLMFKTKHNHKICKSCYRKRENIRVKNFSITQQIN